MSDVSLMLTIVTLFVILGTFVPIVEKGFTGEGISYEVSAFEEDISSQISDTNTTDYSTLGVAKSGFNIFISIISMFFWTFGSLPWWFDTILIIPRVMLAVLFARWIRGN